MNCHHADALASSFGLSLDLGVVALEPAEKTCQGGDRSAFVIQSLREKGVECVFCFVSKPCEDVLAAFVARQNALNEIIGAQKIGDATKVVEYFESCGMCHCFTAQRFPEIAFAICSQRKELLFRPAKEWRAQNSGK